MPLRSLPTRLIAIALISLLHPATPGTATEVPATTYLPHTQIVIDGNDDLTPANGVVGGTGAANDPYRITGWAISGPGSNLKDSAIRITNVTKHLLVHDNLLFSPAPGSAGLGCAIWLETSSNVSFLANRFIQTVRGVCAIDSKDLRVERNDFRSTNTDLFNLAINAVVFNTVADSTIRDNRISSFMGGIVLLDGANGNLVEENLLIGNGIAGAINVESSSVNNTVLRNHISQDSGTAIQIFSSNNQVRENSVDGANIGIWIGRSTVNPENVTIEDNSLDDTVTALRLRCGSCSIQYNKVEGSEILASGTGGLTILQYNLFIDAGDVRHQRFDAKNNSFGSASFTVRTGNMTDLRYNWWGDSSGPASGTIEGTTKFEPWLTTPPEHLGPRS